LVGAGLITLVGCAGQGDVSGVVKYKGAPLGMGTIAFHSDGKVWSSPLASNGSFTVTKVKTGPAKITVMTPLDVRFPGQAPAKIVSIPAKYADPEKSGLTYEVHAGPQTNDLNLD
jgi:hypothetical protein